MGMFATWWRARGARHSASGPQPAILALRGVSATIPSVPPPTADAGSTGIHAGDAMRRFLSFALDGSVSGLFLDEEDPRHRQLLAAASSALGRLEVQARHLPRRPSLLPKLLSAMNSDGNSMRELAAIIGGDPTLLGNLLRVANSAFYRVTEKPVESLERAVILVGTDGIRSLIATALLHPVLSRGNGCFARFPEYIWEQTQYAADAAEMHAQRIEGADAFGARLLALLHGLATNAVFRIVRDEALMPHEQAQGGEAVKLSMIAAMEQWVAPTAERIATSWELPDDIRAAITNASHPLARSLFFGRLAGSQLALMRRGLVKEASARALVLAGDTRRAQVDRVWSRLAASYGTP